MFEIEPDISKNQYEDNLWLESECYRFYVEQRKSHCRPLDIMDLWLLAPYCSECAASDPFERCREPDIVPQGWELDMLINVGRTALDKIQHALDDDADFSLPCKQCQSPLRPWRTDSVHVVAYHLEEHYGIDINTPGKKAVCKKRQIQIIKLYGKECFACKVRGVPLEIDHIMPQSQGGDSAFRNLQPLCTTCNNKKGNQVPSTRRVFSTMYFESSLPDSCEGLFW